MEGLKACHAIQPGAGGICERVSICLETEKTHIDDTHTPRKVTPSVSPKLIPSSDAMIA